MVDGDDYTWGGGLPEPDTDSPEAWRAAVAVLQGPDLRTLDAKERDDVAALTQRLEEVWGAIIYQAKRIAVLEQTVALLAKVLEVRLP